MNPRKRRAIARMLAAGIKGNDINNDSLRDFVKSNGNIAESKEVIVDIAEPEVVTSNTQTTKLEETVEENTVITKKKKTKKKAKKVSQPALKMRFSMKNTKNELLTAAKKLGIDTKSSMNKQTILNLINTNN
tara:strand:+ start:259 stop:654 length:396 start_codon:yes stop_codon:yes gene_type:complete